MAARKWLLPKTEKEKQHCRNNVKKIADKKRAATHCKRNHEFSLENTYWRKDGRRVCRTCNRDRQWYHKRGLEFI